MTRWLLALLFVLPTDAPRVSIYLVNPVVMAGSLLRIVCKVPRHPENRLLIYGVPNYTQSERQLNGANSQISWQVDIPAIPCEAERAFCTVRTLGFEDATDAKTIQVAGCEPARR